MRPAPDDRPARDGASRRRARTRLIVAAAVVVAAGVAAAVAAAVGDDDDRGGAGAELVRIGDHALAAVRPSGAAANWCVLLVGPGEVDHPVCTDDARPMAGRVVHPNGTTVVYGVVQGAVEVDGAVRQVATGELRQAGHGSATAFLAVWNAVDADGVITARAPDGSVRTLVVGDGLPED